MRLKIILITSIVILYGKSHALVCTACSSGNFMNASTWSCGCIPTGFDQITIPWGYTVTITSALNLTTGGPPAPANTLFTINGTLYFSGNASRLDMVASGVIVLNTGGKIATSDSTNNSQKINIGAGSAEWDSKDGTLFGPLIMSNAGLPIELLSFTGSCFTNFVQLNWSTATEVNNESFMIEKSKDGLEWQLLAKIPGNGTTGSVQHYIHTDHEVNSNGLTYYRLSQIDKDQSKTVFKAIDVNCQDETTDKMILYSNPAYGELNIVVNLRDESTNNRIKIINNIGQMVMETEVEVNKGLNTWVIPLDLDPGTYHVVYSSEKTTLPGQKLLITK